MSDFIRESCPDCGAATGELHRKGCDVEPCPYCGGQRLSCRFMGRCGRVRRGDRIPWTGEWPGDAECREFGWYAKPGPDRRLVACGPDEPGASLVLNRLHADAVWDRASKRFVRKGDGRTAPGAG